MKKISLSKKQINYKDYVKKHAFENDCADLIDEECIITEQGTGKLLGLYCKPKGHESFFSKLKKACLNVKYQNTQRTSTLVTTSRIFGYRPRVGMRGDYCSVAALAREQKEHHKVFADAGKIASDLYAEHNPDLHASHSATCEKVLPQFRLKGSPYTSGIINDNNPLCYHFDTGNFNNVWSAMIVLKSGIKNGHLVMPEYNVKVKVDDETVFFFDGQSILHGVTPIIKTNPWGRRFSIVYYSLRGMWKCLPIDQEIARIRNARTKMETKGYVPKIRKKKK